MINYINKEILNENEKVDLKGLNHEQVMCHLAELRRPESFISNLNENYTMPKHIHYMSLADGTDFDALLVNDKMFRYTKLTEADRNDVQDYLNKYAYATALVKLNECATVIGSGLKHLYNKDESYNFLSESYDKLLENISITTEKGKLVESFNSNMEVYEGVGCYIKCADGKRILENWKDTFNHSNLNRYRVLSEKQVDKDAVIRFIDTDGAILEACYINTPANILAPGINLNKLLKKRNLKESYRVGTLKEYNQPFTIDYATITSYTFDGDKLITTVRDAFGNTGNLDIVLNIPAKDFKKKYKGYLDGIVDEASFGDAVDLTSDFLLNAADDIKKVNKLRNKVFTEKNNENQFLSRKVANYTPVTEGSRDPIVVLDKEHFGLTVADKEGKEYSIKYLYTGSQPIRDAVNDIEAEVDDYDFNSKADIISFYQLLDDYGNPQEAYPLNVSTSGRGVGGNRMIKEEAEGVQVTDIAPKLDQGELIKVTMKKRKPLKKELSIDTISEQDAFYGARGFLKDEQGRYHFGDYYLTESGKVVHKSKLEEKFSDETGRGNINTYYDMVYGQIPGSRYDELLQLYMDWSDRIDDKVEEYKNNIPNRSEEENKKQKRIINDEIDRLQSLRLNIEEIPEEERGQNWEDFKEIDKANKDEWAQFLGYSNYDAYKKQSDKDFKKYKKLADKWSKDAKKYSGNGKVVDTKPKEYTVNGVPIKDYR